MRKCVGLFAKIILNDQNIVDYLSNKEYCIFMKKTKFSDQLRKAINESGLSRYRICKETGIDNASMCRFMAGKTGLTTANIDILAELLDISIAVNNKDKAGKK